LPLFPYTPLFRSRARRPPRPPRRGDGRLTDSSGGPSSARALRASDAPNPTPARLPPRAARALSRSASLAVGADGLARARPATTLSPCADRRVQSRGGRAFGDAGHLGSYRATFFDVRGCTIVLYRRCFMDLS